VCQAPNFENVNLVARRRQYFRVYLGSILVAELPQKKWCFNLREFSIILSVMEKECRCSVANSDKNAAVEWRIMFFKENAFVLKFCRNLPMHGCNLFASTEVVHRPRSDSLLYFDTMNIWQICTPK